MTNNSAISGGIFCLQYASNLNITKSVFSHNFALQAQVIYSILSAFSISDSVFVEGSLNHNACIRMLESLNSHITNSNFTVYDYSFLYDM